MNIILIILLVLFIISGLALVALILMHSGKGTGISDMIASSMYSTSGGSSLIEKNLDRLTLISAAIFVICLFAFMIIYPLGRIG